MSRLKLSVAMWDYDRVRALMDGRVEVEGCDINVVVMAPEECFHRAWYHQEFDVCEIGFSAHVIAVSRGEAPYRAIPVFPSRSFRHSCIYVRNDRGIDVPADLRGKKIGVPEYQLAAPMWARGLLAEQYGVKPEEIVWFQGGMEEAGRAEKFRMNLPADFPLHPAPEGETLNGMLEKGVLDGIIAPRTPRAYVTKAAPVRRLWTKSSPIRRPGQPVMGARRFEIRSTAVCSLSRSGPATIRRGHDRPAIFRRPAHDGP